MGSHSGSELSADSAAQLEGFSIDEDGGVWMRLPSGQRTLLGSDQHVIRDEPSQSSHWVHEERHGAAAGLRDGVVLASVVLFLFHLRLDAVDGGGYIVTRLSTEAFGSICLSCSVRTWKMVHYSLFFRPVSGSHCLFVWVLQLSDFREILVLLVRNAWFDSGYMFYAVLAFIERITHFFYVDVDSDCGAFSLFSRRMEKYA